MDINENKKIMAKNIKQYMQLKGVSNQQLCDALGFKYTTFMDWIKGITYPRIGKVEAMANYFGCEKSDLIEDKKEENISTYRYAAMGKAKGVQTVTVDNDKLEKLNQLLKKARDLTPEKLDTLIKMVDIL